MTVLSELSKVAYIGNSSQVLYPIPFEYINVDNIYVSIYTSNNEFVENWTYSNQYIIENSNVKVLSGFEIDNTKKLLIIRVIDAVQDNRYREGGDFPAKSTETSFDKLTMLIQQHQEVLDRCVKVEVLDDQKPEELIDKVFEQLDLATTTGEAAIAAAEQAKEAATSAQMLSETAKQTIETETANSITTINQHSVGILSTMESYATQTQDNATVAQNAVNTLPDYLGQIETKANESIADIDEAVYQRLQVVDALPSSPTSGVYYFIKDDIPPQVANYDYVVDYKAPTSSDPTWYRVYKSGWVEQGGTYKIATTGQGTITFKKLMKDTNYSFIMNKASSDASSWTVMEKTNTRSTSSVGIQANLTGYELIGDFVVSGQGA
jgi:hypothetical protein